MGNARYVLTRHKWGTILLVFITQCILLASDQEKQRKQGDAELINWDEVKKAFDAYESCPGEENAMWILATIPETPAGTQLGTKNAAGIAILDSPLFDKAVVAGDELLAEAAFRLFGYMNGGGR